MTRHRLPFALLTCALTALTAPSASGCVVGVFAGMTLPRPEGGIAPVSQPIRLANGVLTL